MRRLKRSDCSILSLVLKGKWFDMISSGEKLEEYRAANNYWEVRLSNWSGLAMDNNKIPVVEFRRGYSSQAQRIAFIAVEDHLFGFWVYYHEFERLLHPEWGERAIPRYVITLGERIELEGVGK